MRKIFLYFLIASTSVLLFNCRNNDPSANSGGDARDSAYYYSLIFYLWNENLPDYTKFNNQPTEKLLPDASTVFHPRGYETIYDIMQGNNGIRKYSVLTTKGTHADHYSFAAKQEDIDNQFSGNNSGYGATFAYVSAIDLRVASVNKTSPIGKAGVKRGWRVLNVNGIAGDTTHNLAIYNFLTTNNSSTFLFQLPDNSTKTVQVTKEAYVSDFILADTIIETNSLKIGYFTLSDFLGANDGQVTSDELKNLLQDFSNKGVTDMVIDLRYNGGGYVSIAESLCNLLAPANAKQKVMYSTKRNKIITDYYDSKKLSLVTNFDNSAALFNLSRIVFIVSGRTASASELVINNLKPYMNVKLIGSKTYGKPFGFPGLLIEMSKTDKSQNYYVFPVSSQTLNANNSGDYYFGMDVDKLQNDDLYHDFVDPNEANFKDAISFLSTGIFTRNDNANTHTNKFNFHPLQEHPAGINALIMNKEKIKIVR